MTCPVCGNTIFSCMLDLSAVDEPPLTLTPDDTVSCRNCDTEFALGELLADEDAGADDA